MTKEEVEKAVGMLQNEKTADDRIVAELLKNGKESSDWLVAGAAANSVEDKASAQWVEEFYTSAHPQDKGQKGLQQLPWSLTPQRPW